MGAFIARQPNGVLCRGSSVFDCFTDYYMTEDDYIEMCAEKARKESRDVLDHYIKPFEMVDRCFFPNYMTIEEHKRIMKEMEKPVDKATHIP